MSTNRTLQRIGRKLRDESRDIVDAGLPDRLRILLRKLSLFDTQHRFLVQDHGCCGPEQP